MNVKNVSTELIEEAIAERCRRSFYFFVQTFWDTIITEEPVWNWHIEYLCDELQRISEYIVNRLPKPYDMIVNIPPGTSKSTVFSVMLNAWIWTIAPWVQVISNSYSADLSIELATKTKDIVTSDKYKHYFPIVQLRGDKCGKQHYETTEGGFRYATSTGATITGYHAHIIINDDPVNPKQANSEPMRIIANEHTKTLSSRKVNKENTPTITIMQRLHTEDVTGYLLARKADKIRHICLPAEVGDNVSPPELKDCYKDGLLDPVRLNRHVLDELLIDLGSLQYAGQIEQRPTIAGGNIVKREWFKHIKVADFKRMYDNEPIVFFIDTAYTDKTDNDPTGIIATCKIGGDLYVTHAQKVNMKFPDLIRFIPEYAKQHGYSNRSSVRIEPKANGISVVDQLKETTGLNIVRTPSPRDSKETRLYAASPTIESGRVVLVEGAWNEAFEDEVCGFPAKPHDEYVDILGYAIDYHISSPFKPINKARIASKIY
ncbi:MAG: phage terminase large subunit [Paludibacteraceae bacterium]|nr:phage terminase large subunit [Paludibacteraceae bacterium]MBQ6963505.1 phage terminase large subunit [Paludibacteraceae bacterium]MBQ7662482.1 phage terminase large subunit [Prevotella sp.]MBQ7748295.1 phage terminase large subunit [Paludibacteraceae bacterium]